MESKDVIVVGAGLVGSAVAYGLARQGLTVVLLDEGDQVFRASRGNFGLVWVQGKGVGKAAYARWSMGSAQNWPTLAQALQEETGVDVHLQQRGGIHICLSEQEVQDRQARLEWLQGEVGPAYRFQMLDLQAARELMPALGPDVAGISYSTMDGHANPLKLLRALHTACHARMRVATDAAVETITRQDGLFTVHTRAGQWQAPKIVLAAGLANRKLGALIGMDVRVAPNRGQVLITERVAPVLDYPSNYIRQTDEGTIQIGDSMEDAGYDDNIGVPVLAGIAARAIRCMPMLSHLRLVRTWAALRVMSPDGFPIYQESAAMPGAYAVTCHSGVTLAAQHALTIAPWIAGGERPDTISEFGADRFQPALTTGATHAH